MYWGEEPWDGPEKLSDMFADGPWGSYAWDLKMNILDVCRMTDEEICGYTSELRTVFGFRKYAMDKEKLRRFIDNNQEYFSNVSETALNAMNELTHLPELKELRETEYQTQEGGVDVCSGIRGMIEDGREEGIREGIREGRKAGIEEGIQSGRIEQARETASILRNMGLSIAQIAAAVTTSQETVKQWLDDCREKKCNI